MHQEDGRTYQERSDEEEARRIEREVEKRQGKTDEQEAERIEKETEKK